MGHGRRQMLRDVAAVAVVAVFMFPLVWWALTSIKPAHVILDRERQVLFDFAPTIENYAVTLLGRGPGVYDARRSLLDSTVVAVFSALLTIMVALPMAYGLSVFQFRARRAIFAWLIFQRILPPIVMIFPMVLAYHAVGLLDSHPGVILAHTALNLPFAVLLLKSFCDDIPPEVAEAATIDGATRFQVFWKIFAPMLRSGIAATAVLCFVLSWTEFLMSLFLTSQIRMLPVQASIVLTNTWGFTAAVSTAGLIPTFVFILLTQRHLVRGLTLGVQKG